MVKYPIEIVNEMKKKMQKELDLSDKETEEMHEHVMKHWNDPMEKEVSKGKQDLWIHKNPKWGLKVRRK